MFKRMFLLLVIVSIIGCGTDVKPNYFIGMFRDEGDIDRLSTCLSTIPEIDNEGNIIITVNSKCLTDLSKRDTSDPNIEVVFSEILNDPEQYLDKIVTFEAVTKAIHHGYTLELYTNRKARRFYISSYGADIVTLDDEGEEVDIEFNHRYTFIGRIYEIKIDARGLWTIYSAFIITQDKDIIYKPISVKE